MSNKEKWLMAVSTLVCLVPMFIGLALYGQLPEQMATHFNAQGEANGWSSRAFTVFGLPLLIAALHLVCMWKTAHDARVGGVSGKVRALLVWICPAVSILCAAAIYGQALEAQMPIGLVMKLFMGVMLIVLGNYLPKCRRNATVGIKLPWTRRSAENWNATHRFGGRVWMVAGLVMLATAWMTPEWPRIAALAIAVIAPTVYSIVYARKHA